MLTAVLHTVRTLTDVATTFSCCTTNEMHNKSVRVFSQFSFCGNKTEYSYSGAAHGGNLRGLLRIMSRTVRCGPTYREIEHHIIVLYIGIKYIIYSSTVSRNITHMYGTTYKCNTNEKSINNYQEY